MKRSTWIKLDWAAWSFVMAMWVGLIVWAGLVRGDVSPPAGTKNIFVNQNLNRMNLYLLRDLYLADGSSNSMRIRSSELADDNYDWVFPASDGTAGQCLVTDGSEGLSWADVLTPSNTATLTNKTFTLPKINEAVDLTATSTELNQLDDVEIGGSATGDVLTTDGTQEATNKTLTLPKINEAVDLTATSTELNQLTGVEVGGNLAGDIVTTDGAQDMTNKIISLSAIETSDLSDAAISDDLTFVGQASTPSSPNPGDLKVYAKDDGKVYKLNGEGLEQEIGAGGGNGEITYVQNGGAEDGNTTGWVAYKDSGATPTDGTGGTPDATVTFTSQDTTVLAGEKSFQLTNDAAASRQGNGYSYDFKIDSADKNKILKIELYYQTTTNYGDDDVVISVYDKDVGQLISTVIVGDTATPYNGLLGSNGVPAKVLATWPSSSSDDYRVIIHIADSGTSVWDLFLDRIVVGPGSTSIIGSVYGNIEPTVTFNNSTGLTIDSSTMEFYRFGEYLHIGGHLFVAGSGTSSSSFTFSLAGITPVDGGGGHFRIEQATGSERNTFFLYGNGGIFTFFPENTGVSTSIIGTQVGDTGTDYERFYFDTFIKVQEWAGSDYTTGASAQMRSPQKAGFIQAWAGSTSPTGWLAADGTSYKKALYPDLYANIGDTYATTAKQDGTGGNYTAPASDEFRVPDLRGVFLRGVGTSSDSAGNNDISVSLGGYQDDNLKTHTHDIDHNHSSFNTASAGTHGHTLSDGATQVATINGGGGRQGAAAGIGNGTIGGGAHQHAIDVPSFTGTSGSTGDSETRSRNVGLNYIIKAYDDSPHQFVGIDVNNENSPGLSYAYGNTDGTGTGDIYSGKYTPTVTDTAGVTAAVTGPCRYTRIGNTVTVYGQGSFNQDASGNITFYYSLPIASNLANVYELSGLANPFSNDTTAHTPGTVIADTGNDRARFDFLTPNNLSRSFTFTFSYEIL